MDNQQYRRQHYQCNPFLLCKRSHVIGICKIKQKNAMAYLKGPQANHQLSKTRNHTGIYTFTHIHNTHTKASAAHRHRTEWSGEKKKKKCTNELDDNDQIYKCVWAFALHCVSGEPWFFCTKHKTHNITDGWEWTKKQKNKIQRQQQKIMRD